MNFLLNDNEKRAFYKTMRAVMMFDFEVNKDERKILKEIKNNIFYLEESPQPPVADDDTKKERERIDLAIAQEINKIESIIPLVYLFNILYELQKYNKISGYDFKSRIDDILELVDKKEDIKKSKLFLHNASAKKLESNDNEFVSTVKSVFGSFASMFNENKNDQEESPVEENKTSTEKGKSKIDVVHENINKEKGQKQ
jgi:hypothetical protein